MNAMSSSKLGKPLVALYSSDAGCKSLMDWFHGRQRGSHETKVRVAATNTGLSEVDVRAAFGKLAEIGVGEFVVGRRGAESRLRWHYDVKSLAAVARGEIVGEPDEVPHDAPQDDDDDMTEGLLDHEFRLRSDLKIVISLPGNLTKGEAERVANWVRSLPFETV